MERLANKHTDGQDVRKYLWRGEVDVSGGQHQLAGLTMGGKEGGSPGMPQRGSRPGPASSA